MGLGWMGRGWMGLGWVGWGWVGPGGRWSRRGGDFLGVVHCAPCARIRPRARDMMLSIDLSRSGAAALPFQPAACGRPSGHVPVARNASMVARYESSSSPCAATHGSA